MKKIFIAIIALIAINSFGTNIKWWCTQLSLDGAQIFFGNNQISIFECDGSNSLYPEINAVQIRVSDTLMFPAYSFADGSTYIDEEFPDALIDYDLLHGPFSFVFEGSEDLSEGERNWQVIAELGFEDDNGIFIPIAYSDIVTVGWLRSHIAIDPETGKTIYPSHLYPFLDTNPPITDWKPTFYAVPEPVSPTLGILGFLLLIRRRK